MVTRFGIRFYGNPGQPARLGPAVLGTEYHTRSMACGAAAAAGQGGRAAQRAAARKGNDPSSLYGVAQFAAP
ncbi:hypothetical protein SDC9_131049 [bioreactor metagenome]|uniref:Uncharacterized protein n=1 Tax=bioreactor metagenome TaxID=1076179 RepID=A0A645D450_9ZZZZ